jgi:hypothetical protein
VCRPSHSRDSAFDAARAEEAALGCLCLPQIKPEHIGDAVHPGSDGTECAPLPRRHLISARPCSTISECACHCSSPCRTAAHGADGVRRIPRYDQGIPCGSNRSAVPRMRFARVSAETSGGLECRSIERGGQISLRMHRSTLICCLSSRISASSATRDRNRSLAIQKIRRHKSCIGNQHRAILSQLPRVDDDDRLRLPPIPPPQSSGTEKKNLRTATTIKHAGHQASDPRPLRTTSTPTMSSL